MKVKICGITDANTAAAAAEYGADAIGFVFAESKRKITIEKAKEIIDTLPAEVMKVGVFVNETKENIEKTARLAGLTHVQLHGDESVEFCESLTVPVIKALSISSEQDIEKLGIYSCQWFLLDSPKGKYHGGNGTKFDWNLVRDAGIKKQLILAGGLDEGNVETAIKTVRPHMVDVSSGVETEGKKDLSKIKSFIEKAKSAEIEEEVR